MKILACHAELEYFFLGETNEEVEKYIEPLRQSLEAAYQNDHYPHLFVSSKETMEEEMAKQAIIKADPYISDTVFYHTGIGEEPTYDAYVVIKKDLSQLYFVGYDAFYPQKNSDDVQWDKIDMVEVKKPMALSSVDFEYKGKPIKRNNIWNRDEAKDKIDDEFDDLLLKGKKYVIRRVMQHFQAYNIYVEDVEKYFVKANIDSQGFFEKDQIHMHMEAVSFWESKKEQAKVKRTFEEEDQIYEQMEEDGESDVMIELRLLHDFVDGIIDLQTFKMFFTYNDFIQSLDDEKEARKQIWTDLKY